MIIDKIRKQYRYDRKSESTSVLSFPEKSITTITRSTPGDDGVLETEVVVQGMTKDEIEAYFPPQPSERKKGATYNLTLLIQSLVYEAYRKNETRPAVVKMGEGFQ